jgi:peptide/nickel transport system ATP-binding protein
MSDNASKQPSLVQIKDLCVEFQTENGWLRAVDRLSLDIPRGCSFGLVGESGCGKTVTAMSIPRLVPQPPGRISQGEILFEGQDLLKLPSEAMRARRGRDIGVIFQEPMTALSPLHRIGEQLAEVLRIHRQTSRRDAMSIATDWLQRVGIPDPAQRLQAYPFELSGGMRQRVMIAMAMILHPKLIIADEPTTALDVTIQAQILDLMRSMLDEHSSLLLITHDMGVIWEMCSDMAVMYASRIVESGPVRELFAKPLHPYTSGLMQAMPSIQGSGKRLKHIPGQVPSLLRLPDGCAFADRCAQCMPQCRQNPPPSLRQVGRQWVACHLHQNAAAEAKTRA